MRAAVLLIVDDEAFRQGLTAEVEAVGGKVVAEPALARIVVADGDAPDVARRIEDATQGRRVDLLGLASEASEASLDQCAEIALKPLRPGELGLRLSRIERRRSAGADRREELLAIAVESSGDVVEITDAHHVYEYVNGAFERTLGYSAAEVLGAPAGRLLRSQLQSEEFFSRMDETLAAGNPWSGIVLAKAKDGRVIQFESAVAPVLSDDGRVAHHVAVRRDITQRVAAEASLRTLNDEISQARDAAVEASHSKSRFLANMSHELRTPLNAIIGYTEILKENAEDRGDAADLKDLERVTVSAAHLLSLIDDVLDLSRIEAGQLDLVSEPISMKSLIAEAVGTIQPLAFERGNEIVVEHELPYDGIETDVKKLRQLLLNLLSNANKFTERGPILIRTAAAGAPTERSGEYLAIEVSDAGIGMTEEQACRVFESFVQADSSTTRQYGGTGLGLALSRAYCHLMQGDISVSSAIGEGSTFRVVLPRRLSRPGRTRPAS